MDSRVPEDGAVAAPAQAAAVTAGIITAFIIIVVLSVAGAIAIALGVGLGVGLDKENNVHTTTTTTANNSLYSILAPPSVNCTYVDPDTCGCSATQPVFATPRIVQGYPAKAHSWPWVVYIERNIGNGRVRSCGGALIDFQHVLTAAHCVPDGTQAKDVEVYAGIQKISEPDTDRIRGVSKIIAHKDYDPDTFENDIAVLVLDTPIDKTKTTVGLCCLNYDTALPNVGDRGVVAGWGATSQGGESPDDLLQAVVEVHNPSTGCKVTSTDIQYCAGYQGTDTCQGDSGGPFMIGVNNTWVCGGIVSFGIGCGTNDGVYARVAAYQTFIEDIINP